MNANVARLLTFAQHGQPNSYGGSDMMRSDFEFVMKLMDDIAAERDKLLEQVRMAREQEPVAYGDRLGTSLQNAYCRPHDAIHGYAPPFHWMRHMTPLYAIPPIAAQQVPEGWQLVPKEPTEEMLEKVWTNQDKELLIAEYRAMLAAAPKPECAA